MQDQIDQHFKIKQKQGERISLSKLRHNVRQQKVDQQTINRLEKLKKYAAHDLTIPTEKLNSYYCSLCGQIALITNIYLESMPTRKTDNSIAIDLKENFIKMNLQKERIKHIKRQNGVQVQYRYRCECGMPLAYTAVTFDELDKWRQSEKEEGKENVYIPKGNRLFLYVYEGAMVERMKDSKLVSELNTYKETILLHLKKKTLKK